MISIKISLKFVPKGPINNILALVQMMAWRRPGDEPLSEPMAVSLPTHICVARPPWVKCTYPDSWRAAKKHMLSERRDYLMGVKSMARGQVQDLLILTKLFVGRICGVSL